MADDAPPNKACSKCGVAKSPLEFHASKKGKYGVESRCKKCKKDMNSKMYADNKDKKKAEIDDWRAKNPEKLKTIRAKWYQKNSEKEKHRSARYVEKHQEERKHYAAIKVKELADTYIASKLHIPVSQSPPELLALKREQIKLLRATNQLKKEMKNVE